MLTLQDVKLGPARRKAWPARIFAALLVAAGSFATAAQADSDERQRMGWVEKVLIEPGAIPLKAKLDTGAKTSSLHAKDIEIFKKDGDNWVRFRLEVEDTDGKDHDVVLERRRVRRVRIKEHEGEYDRRPVVRMSFCIAGERRSAQFTLADRSRFIYPVLLGRRFLEDHALVDAGATFLTQARCPSEPEGGSDS